LDDFLRRHNMPVPTAFQEGNKRVLILAAGPEADALARDMRTWTDDLTVTLARSGFEAGFEVSSRPPHLFIVDVDDPRWDGIAVFRAVHEDGRGSRVQMAAMGMDSSVERMEALQRAGVLHCFSKPVVRADLCRFVKQMFPSCDWKVNLRKASRGPDR
jgi:response regulator RpfG family c-di-GMP phosphodiesterase